MSESLGGVIEVLLRLSLVVANVTYRVIVN